MEKGDEIKALSLQVEALAEDLKKVAERQNSHYTDIMLVLKRIEEMLSTASVEVRSDDELYEEAKECVIEHQSASTSFLQRILSVGYARACFLIDRLESDGVIGPGQGAKPRAVLIKRADE
jgi:S-DNA-T family DNA segregation ATPase FtsK/SpoIIIE